MGIALFPLNGTYELVVHLCFAVDMGSILDLDHVGQVCLDDACWRHPVRFLRFCITDTEYPPTPALAKAGAAPGTTAGVELVFLSVQCLNASPCPHGRPIACRLPALNP